jgi:hypothetical protein
MSRYLPAAGIYSAAGHPEGADGTFRHSPAPRSPYSRGIAMTVPRIVSTVVLFLALLASSPTAAPEFSDWTAPVNLGPIVNSAFNDIAPAISKDGLSLYFQSNRPGGVGGLDLWACQRARTEDPWGPPANLGPIVNTPSTEGSPAFSRDGHWMFFNSNRPGGFGGTDIWVTWRAHIHDDFGWQPPVNLGPGVNTPSGDGGASYFENEEAGGPLLFFGSARPGGAGAGGIYVSALLGDGSFGPATLVPELGSPQDDMGPKIRFDGLEIVQFSNRVGSVGAYDLWASVRGTVLDTWFPPENLGVVVNGSSNELTPYLSADRRLLFFASDRPGGFGGTDLYVSTREHQAR